jgi:hypothetical protein
MQASCTSICADTEIGTLTREGWNDIQVRPDVVWEITEDKVLYAT